ncbi:MAG: alpha/beta hydrolase [Gammaproteobacteria bacterium]|nr:MAG: alpha/beta hydrolase [Gammaproteobacteria bacterium]
MKVIFSHGRLGRPDGQKVKRLSAIAQGKGWQTASIDYTDTLDPDVRADRLIDIVKQQDEPFCLVGSSMGGYASLVAAEQADRTLLSGVFLMAPALFMPIYRRKRHITDIRHVEIVHGWHDDIILYEHSVRYAHSAGCTLHLIDDNHHLSKQPEQLDRFFTAFLDKAKKLISD